MNISIFITWKIYFKFFYIIKIIKRYKYLFTTTDTPAKQYIAVENFGKYFFSLPTFSVFPQNSGKFSKFRYNKKIFFFIHCKSPTMFLFSYTTQGIFVLFPSQWLVGCCCFIFFFVCFYTNFSDAASTREFRQHCYLKEFLPPPRRHDKS